MKKIITSVLIISYLYPGVFGETEEEKRNAIEKLRLAMTLQQNPKIKKIRDENKYLKKLLTKHNINYKQIIKQKKKAKKINDINNFFLVNEKKEIETLEQINKELIRLLEVNYIKYKKIKYKSNSKNKEIKRNEAKDNLLKQMNN